MPRFDTVSCEPFRAWNRLEPRSRTTEFDRVLQVGVHDALWMLTRQWQFGEFKAEDTGSAIFAKMQLQFTQLSHYRALNGTPQPYTDPAAFEQATTLEQAFQRVPAFEQQIEQIPAPLNDKVRLQAGQLFLSLLTEAARAFAGAPAFDRAAYQARLKELLPLPAVPPLTPEAEPDVVVAQARAHTNTERAQFLAFFGHAACDGVALYQQAKADLAGLAGRIRLASTHAFVATSLQHFLVEMEQRFAQELQPMSDAWNPRQLEYQFKCLLPDDNAAKKTVLTAEEYYSGQLDWYSVDVDATAAGQQAFADTEPSEALLRDRVLTVIPTEARFAGMPNARWWQFEEGEVDLGNIRSDTTDLAKLVFSEYALLYGNNYLMVPIPVPVGTLSEVKGIVVTDVFGERQFVGPAIQGQTDNWTSWGMFNLSTRQADGNRNQPADTRLWVPPVTVKTLESDPVEHVYLLRDEIANMVWAIETKVENSLGRALDGHNFAVSLRNLLEQIDVPPVLTPDEAAALQYTLANQVPENWIPFIPVHLPGQNRAIQLQRAAMPRWFRDAYHPVRPQTAYCSQACSSSRCKPTLLTKRKYPGPAPR
jgi:hypothetical protein